MDTRIEELIAIGASITANCQPCLEYHVQKAKENGADQQQISKAIEVGKMVRKGSAGKMDKVILNISRDTEMTDAELINEH
jgi:AhpD family alkylhydroperoxidase